MALTREFKETVMERVQNDPAFGEALLQQGVHAMLDGEIEVGKSILRDAINATIRRPQGSRHCHNVVGLLVQAAVSRPTATEDINFQKPAHDPRIYRYMCGTY